MRPHEVEWTPERIQRFWNYYSANQALDDTYFAATVGRSLIGYLRRYIQIGVAIDVGCGRGDLIEHLVSRGFRAYGMDQSPESIELVRRRFAGNRLFLGAGNEPPPADTAFMLEVVEHMNDDALSGALDSVRSILKPGGYLVVTTPNEENRQAMNIMCPECGCIFHRMQHVRSWSKETLQSRMESAGYRTVRCEPYRLGWRHGLMGRLDKIRFRHEKPNLIYIGARPQQL